MSQIQVTGEAKIRDLQGPVVANSGVITALDGLPSQYVRGDGTLADIPSVTGGGASVSYYLNGSVNQGTFGGSTYYQLGENAITGVGTNFSTSTDGLLAQFITDVNVPDVTEIPSGNWNIEFYMGVSASSGALASFYAELYKYDGATFTLIASSIGTPEILTNTTTVSAYFSSIAVPQTTLLETDRIAIRVYASVAGKTVTLYTEDNRLCQVVTTFSRGMLSLNSLTDQQQYLTVGTAGTDFNIVSALDTHTFNIPSASATNRGLITTGTQTIAGAKTFSSTATFNTGGVFNNWGISLYDGAGSTALSSSTLTGIYASKSGSITDIVISHNAPYDSILRFSNDVANFTYTFPDLSGTIALLEQGQTFTGDKTFDGITNFDSAVLFNALQNQFSNGFQISKTNTILRNTGYMTISANAGTGSSIKFSDGNSTYDTLFNFDNTGNRNYTFPASSGTVALTSNLSAYLPLTGGTLTGTLNGTFGIFSVGVYGFGLQAQGDVTNAGVLQLKHTGSVSVSSGNVAIAADSANTIGFYFAGSSTAKFSNASLTSTRTYTLPDASGTLALTSNITSAINGTSTYIPVFTGANSIGNSQIWNNGGIIGMGTNYSSPAFSVVASSGDTVTQGKLAINTTSFSGTSVLQVNGTTQSTGYFLTGMTAGSGALYYNAGANRVTLANYNASGILTFEVNGGATALTLASTGAATFSSSVSATSATLSDTVAITLTSSDSRILGGNSTGRLLLANSGTSTYGIFYGASHATAPNAISLATDNTERIRVTNTGNVGIGTSSPVSIGGYTALTLNNATTGGILTFQQNGTNKGSIYNDASNIYLGVNSGAAIFETSGTERMRITSGGDVCIGTTTVNDKLTINGGIRSIGSSAGYFWNDRSNASNFYGWYTTSNTIYLFNGTANAASINPATGIYTPLSDINKKKDFEESTIGLNAILGLKPTLYRMKTDNESVEKKLGFIAQEVKEFIPQAYVESGEGDNKFIGLNDRPIIAALVKAIQEQQAQIEELKSLIAAK